MGTVLLESATLDQPSTASASLSPGSREVSSQFEDDLNYRTLVPAFTIDATASTPIGLPCHGLRGENLLNMHVEAAISSDSTVERVLPRIPWLELTLR